MWQPHPGQIPVGNALFYQGKKRVFVRCGRKWGKTEMLAYALYRWAGTTPNGQFYYVAPYYNQAAEIIWHPGRLQTFLGEHAHKYIDKINDTDRRIIFKNGSFIKLVGADNHQAGRGFNPDGAVYDEFKDHDYRFHEGFVDNLITKKAPLLIVGTPPPTFNHFFVRTEDDFKVDTRGSYFKMPTHSNPYIDAEELAREKESAVRKGEWAKYMREIEAEIVPGGANAIFPMLEVPRYDERGNFVGESRHVKEHSTLIDEVQRHDRDYDYYLMFDPGSSITFAALFVAIHRGSKKVFVLDEIYVTDRMKTSTKQIYPVAQVKMAAITKRYEWRQGYDHAATWFQVEVYNEFNVSLLPCTKDIGQDKKEDRLSTIKDFMLADLFVVSKNCPNFISELSTYATDEKGKIPKLNDHLIDCIRYIFREAYLHTVPKTPYVHGDDIRIHTKESEYEYEDDEPINMYEMESEFLMEESYD